MQSNVLTYKTSGLAKRNRYVRFNMWFPLPSYQ
uniref:Uncharacterized protein n=1 Tax=Anguilla anguilla TaxID=7936 RepID=A0A0E9VI73_ANGAN